MHKKTDAIDTPHDELHFPHESHPGPDQAVEIAPGVLWLRLKLPFRLNHVNIYLLADGDGWAMVDTGFGNEATIAAWETLFDGPLAGFTISRVIVTHAHPDHVGMAGWIVRAVRLPALHVADRISAGCVSPEPAHRRAHPQQPPVLPPSWHRRNGDRAAGRPRPGLPEKVPCRCRRPIAALASGHDITIGPRTFQSSPAPAIRPIR